MSSLKVEILKIEEISEHPNADKLELARLKGWFCVIQKDKYKVGDKVVYIPVDSVLPETLEADIFGKDSKVKLSKHRVKTIKLRGAISQGLVVNLKDVGLVWDTAVGADVTDKLGITKYEPPSPRFQGMGNKTKKRYKSNTNFHKYTSIENIKNNHKVFDPEDDVVITEKIHGTNFRAGWVPYDPNTWWKKIKHLVGLAPKHEFIYGSHNVQLSQKLLYKGYYDKNVYADAVVTHNLKEKLGPGQVVYGEIYGPNIQKGYGYGLKEGQTKLIVFDVMQDGKYLNHINIPIFGALHSLDVVPVLYEGKFAEVDLDKIVGGKSSLCGCQKIREGVVVRPQVEAKCHIGRKILKSINSEYLLKENTEFH